MARTKLGRAGGAASKSAPKPRDVWLERELRRIEVNLVCNIQSANIQNGRVVQVIEWLTSDAGDRWARLADETHSIVARFPSTCENRSLGKANAHGLQVGSAISLHDVALAFDVTPVDRNPVLHLVIGAWAQATRKPPLITKASRLVDIGTGDQFNGYREKLSHQWRTSNDKQPSAAAVPREAEDERELTPSNLAQNGARSRTPEGHATMLSHRRDPSTIRCHDEAYTSAGGDPSWIFGAVGVASSASSSSSSSSGNGRKHPRDDAEEMPEVEPSPAKRARVESAESPDLFPLMARAARAHLEETVREAKELGVDMDIDDDAVDPVRLALERAQELERVKQRHQAQASQQTYSLERAAPPPIAVSQLHRPRPPSPPRPTGLQPLRSPTVPSNGFFTDTDTSDQFRHSRPNESKAVPERSEDERSTTHESLPAPDEESDDETDGPVVAPIKPVPRPHFEISGRPVGMPLPALSTASSRRNQIQARAQQVHRRISGELRTASPSTAVATQTKSIVRPSVITWALPPLHDQVTASLERLLAYNSRIKTEDAADAANREAKATAKRHRKREKREKRALAVAR